MSTQLRELFDGAAESQPPDGLAARAVAGARRRRTQRYTVAGSVLAAAAVVLGFVVVSSSQRLDSAPRPNEVARLPDALPAPDGLPKLTADSMDFATAAYVVDGDVVVIDADTGEAALVDFRPPPGSLLADVTPAIGPDASLALSPDGRFLMASSGDPNWEVGSSREWMWMVDVATGSVAAQTSFQLVPARDDVGVLLNRMAWSPDGTTFACVCRFSSRPQLYLMRTAELEAGDLVFNSAEGRGVVPRQISWGTDGLAGQFAELDADWRMVPASGAGAANLDNLAPLAPPSGAKVAPSAVVMSTDTGGGYLAWFDVLATLVTSEGSFTFSTGPDPMALGALGDGYFSLIRPGYAVAGDPNEVYRWRLDSESSPNTAGQSLLTTVPAGTTTITFASDLVD